MVMGVVNVEMMVEMVMLNDLNPVALLSPPLHPINNTPNNQSKPIIPTPSYSLS